MTPYTLASLREHVTECRPINHISDQIIYRFPNGIGASIVTLDDDEPEKYELAVLRFYDKHSKHRLLFPENGIVEYGIKKYTSLREVEATLRQIKAL